jgi:hypothetical protein
MERDMKARKKDTPAGGRKNYFLETLLFLAVMVLTLRFCFSGQKPQEIWAAVKSMRGMSLAGAVALGLFFVCMEDHKDSAWGSRRKKRTSDMYQLFVSRIFLFRNHTVRDRRTADAAL